MVKNRPRKLLGHLVDILILINNKNFLSIFWLEIWWDVARHPNTPFLQGSWVLASRKVAWTAKSSQNLWISPVGPHQKNFKFCCELTGLN